MPFLSDLSRQESTKNSQQEFDVPEFRTGHGRHASQTTHDGDLSPDVSDTMSHCFPEHAEISNSQVSHFSECAEEPNKGFALLRMRRILELQIEMDKLEFLAECAKRARCEENNTGG